MWAKVCRTGDIPEGNMKGVEAGDKEILVANIGGRFYAIGNRCPHMNGKLSEGKLSQGVVTCPRHGSQFDVTDGRMVRWAQMPPLVGALSRLVRPPRPATAYPAKVEGDEVLVEV